MRKLIPLLLAAIGLGAGVGGGLAMRPEPAPPEAGAEHDNAKSEAAASQSADKGHAKDGGGESDGKSEASAFDYVKLKNQFIVPVLRQAQVSALVVLSIDLEVKAGLGEEVYRIEPRLRDNFLGVLFDHANAGGFDGAFTTSGSMTILRTALLEAGRMTLGEDLENVLITDIMRQET